MSRRSDNQNRASDDDQNDEQSVPAAPRQVETDADMIDALSDFIVRNPNVLGGGDILTITGGRPVARAGMLAAILAGLALEGGARAIRGYLIVIPPAADAVAGRERAWEGFTFAFARLAGRSLTPAEEHWLLSRFEVRAAPDGRAASILALIGDQRERTAIIVTEAADYRDDAIAPFVREGAETPLVAEDVWVPQLHSLAQAAVAVASEKSLYVALDADELSPIRPQLEQLLRSVDGCGVMGAADDNRPETILARHVDTWDRWIAEGRVGRVLRDVNELPTTLNSEKPFLRVQLLHKAGLRLEALAAIRSEFLSRGHLDPSSRVRLARIAGDAGASRLARELLEPCITHLDSREELESALRTAEASGSNELQQKLANRLETRFPGAEGVQRHHRRLLLRDRDYASVADLLRPADAKRATFYDALATALSGSEIPDYMTLIGSAQDNNQAEAFRLASVEDALSHCLTVHAFELALARPASSALTERWQRLLLEALERCFLDCGPSGSPPVEMSRIEEGLRALVASLACDPLNAALRFGLVDLLRPNVSGTTGLALIAKLVLDEAANPITPSKGFKFGSAGMDWLLNKKPFLNRALDWLKSEEPILIGKLALPAELLTEDADAILSAIASYLERVPLADASDIESLQLWLTLAAAVAPHSSDPDVDLRLYRLAAGKLASYGFPQHARDLVEVAVQAGTATPRRRRLAWFSVADVYHRVRDYLAGLVALACAFAADDHADEEEIWQEIYALARFMRDAGLSDVAFATIAKGRDVLARMSLLKPYGHRLDLLELQVRQTRLDEHDAKGLAELLSDAIRVGKEVLKRREQTAPAGITLGQLIRAARTAAIPIPDDAETVFRKLNKWAGGNLAAMIVAASSSAPTAAQVAELVASMPRARYAEDVGFDTSVVARLARRALTDNALLLNSVETSFTLEVLSDWGAALPGWDEAAAPPSALRKEEPAAIARSISSSGPAILQLGLDANGSLIRAISASGRNGAAIREASDIFSQEAFHDWMLEFPRRYGYDDSPNLFYTTTDRLRLSAVPEGPTIVVAATELQTFPPNLLFANGEFLGRRQPVAAAPSLAWLSGARDRSQAGDGRMVAWISTAEGEDGRATLSLLAQRLEAPFADFGFLLDTSPVIPRGFADATMAVITAHGRVHPEGRYFQVVSDEGTLRVSAADLAAAVRNVGVVVLFVCSGGRSDKHPGANTTLGLAKQILDRGCSAVIASPWPLDSQVPPHWLPAFLAEWANGATLIEANFSANRVVDARFALDPARGLAMTVYGDPLLKRLRS